MKLLVLAFAQVVSLAPPDVSTIVDLDDYPSWAIDAGYSAAATVDPLIEPSGRIGRCDLIETFGAVRLADRICKLALGKRAKPARDAAGQPVHARVSTLLKFTLPGTPEGNKIGGLVQAPHFTLSVKSLPDAQIWAEVEVALEVNEAGKVTHCMAAREATRADFIKAICGVAQQLGVGKLTNEHGTPIRYVTVRKVELRVEAETKAQSL